MKFVILDNKEIPGFGGARGPILTPTAYNLHDVLKWITFDIDIREVMSDGSYRKLQFNDERIMKEINEELEFKRLEKAEQEEVTSIKEDNTKPVETYKNNKSKKASKVPNKKPVEESKKEDKVELVVDELEKM